MMDNNEIEGVISLRGKIVGFTREKTGIPGLDAEALLYAIRDLQQKSFAAE